MRAGAAATALLVLLALGACGDGGRNDAPVERAERPLPAPNRDLPPTADQARATQLDSALAAQGLRLNEAGHQASYAAAGFEVFWPSGCGQLRTGEPTVLHDGTRQEFRYACDRNQKVGHGCAVYVVQNGKDESGGPPSPPMVVHMVEDALRQYAVRAERQRPLTLAGIEGVEVQAVQPGGPGEVWVRGLLAGPTIYVLTAWNVDGGLFDDVEIRDFFASFRLVK
jgi:hypothetical protein